MNRNSRIRAFCSRLPAALALGALAVSAGVQAAEPDEISITAPSVTTVGRDDSTVRSACLDDAVPPPEAR